MTGNDNVTAVQYDPSNGKITGIRGGTLQGIRSEGKPYVLGTGHWDTHYVDTSGRWPEIRPRPELPITQDRQTILADGEDFVVFEGVPASAEVSVRNTLHIMADDGSFEFATLMPGEYEITFSKWPYLNHRAAVTAR